MGAGAIINTILKPVGLKLSKHIPSEKKIELDPADGGDDYNWKLYHQDYTAQIAEMSKEVTQKLSQDDFTLENNQLSLKADLLPLHPNHTVLYETIASLKPSSVIEVGCGGGDHLHNLGVLFPALQRQGLDRSEGQLSFLKERSPHLKELVSVFDATMPPSKNLPSAEVVYSQAVIMHIQAGNGHLVALSNMFKMAEKTVVLMENFKRHNFIRDIKYLHENGMIAWDQVNFYTHKYNNKPHILVVSNNQLNLEPLGDYNQLIDAMS